MDAKEIFTNLAEVYGLIEVNTSRAGSIKVVETGIDVRNAVVSERPGEGFFVELEDFPVMATTPEVAAAFERHSRNAEHGMALFSFEDDGIRLIAIAEGSYIYMDGNEVILDDETLPMAA